jgi:hypothetical protein
LQSSGPRLASGRRAAVRGKRFIAYCRLTLGRAGLTDGSTSCHRATPGGPGFDASGVLAQAGEVDRCIVYGAAALARPLHDNHSRTQVRQICTASAWDVESWARAVIADATTVIKATG